MVKKGKVKKLKKAYKVYKNSYGNRSYANASMKASKKRVQDRKYAWKRKYRQEELRRLKSRKSLCREYKTAFNKKGACVGCAEISRAYYYYGCSKYYGSIHR